MEHTYRKSTYSESKRYVPKLRLSPFLLIVVIMLVGFGVMNMSVTALAQYSPAPVNPFPAYADIFPGQPASAVEARTFSCQNYTPAETSCTFTPTGGAFLSIQVGISEGIIRDLIFILRDNTLQIGDLEMFLKMPTLHRIRRGVSFFLPESVVIAKISGYPQRFSQFLYVSKVTFTNYPL
ncbi:MAG: hypothetical protein ABI690_00280 [Chloroflexota bacterium]